MAIGNSFNFEDARRQAARDIEEMRRRAYMSQSSAPTNLQKKMQQLGLNPANVSSSSQSATFSVSQIQQLMGTTPQPRKPKMTPLNPPQFLEGYRVTVRSGKKVWTVHHFEEREDPYQGRYVRFYYLEDADGRQSREDERELRIHENAADKKATVDFDTVIISQEKRDQILEALEQVNQTDLIFEEWGFGETIEKGRGVSMLFYGPPGTGKTLMAQAIANKLGYKLKVISTADIESSAPGEAERNIRKYFKEAGKNSILLFDECDSLIYSRQNVGAILGAQINELLSQIERFNGITLFTTNRLGTLDEAVNRRLALKLEFDMPSEDERALIWQRMFPEKAPLAKNIDWKKLATIEITGGYIKNAVLRAARMAAAEKIDDDKKKIRMKHLVKALRFEAVSMLEFEEARKKEQGGYGYATQGKVRSRGKVSQDIARG